jgi:mRNA interferase RelE/StbE
LLNLRTRYGKGNIPPGQSLKISFEILIPDKIRKKILNLPKVDQDRIRGRLDNFSENPQLGKHLTGLSYWTLRVGKYRIIYRVDNQKLIIMILSIGHRKNIYDNM